ncbi:unnamed protein product [Fraxinus pennsylvanica]|uniref:Uncharacterized protein n=1 Tax=Fraxinus pennsylvanica TaxID=56036 RepID=A0AAD2AAC1_9LAMI|nr:unnamed protein product [Fraxinus pennsylvanica]
MPQCDGGVGGRVDGCGKMGLGWTKESWWRRNGFMVYGCDDGNNLSEPESFVGCCDWFLFDWTGGETERCSSMNMFRTLINRRARRSLKTWGLEKAPTWMVWRPSLWSISHRLHTKEQASQLISESSSNLKPYIVHVAHPTGSSNDLLSYYQTFLPEESRMIYSYHTVFKGFAARLSPEEVKAMEKIPGFISARVQDVVSLYTTHSPYFLGLNYNMGLWKESNYGKGVIIGVIDSGIFPDHPSFSDEGMPPPPAKWKGKCQFNFKAGNNKLIGAKDFSRENGTPLDENGHGTHVASIAAGNFVPGANLFGNANGTTAGIAPLAHLAMYKIKTNAYSEIDIKMELNVLRAIDAAISDGVDVISLSVGCLTSDYLDDLIAIGAFKAIERGIFVCAAAGNEGPNIGTVANYAPLILTVGASTIDRKIRATVVLGNNLELDGESAFQRMDFTPMQLSLVYLGSTASNSFCILASLANIDVRGKVVLCETGRIGRIKTGQAFRKAGCAAVIFMNKELEGDTINLKAHFHPVVYISYADGLKVIAYINSTATPRASLSFKGTIIGDDRAPSVAYFSGRGPNPLSIGILKPDIIGPGVNIVAAWHVPVEKISTKCPFNMISGTSMATPHLSGIASLLKCAHPSWSPAMIKSAIMTTADPMNIVNNPIEDQTLQPANIFATGSGHVNAIEAIDPGLVYDIHPEEYIRYLFSLNYTNEQVNTIVSREVDGSNISGISDAELNYPSFGIFLRYTSQTYFRTVTNVGEDNSIYSVVIDSPLGINVSVEPSRLQFSKLNQKLTYKVTFSRSATVRLNSVGQGSLIWISAKYSVRSPIVVYIE